MPQKHANRPCTHHSVRYHGGRRRQCSVCKKPWRIRAHRRGRKRKRSSSSLALRVLTRRSPSLRTLAADRGKSREAVRRDFHRSLAALTRGAAWRSIPEEVPLIAIADALRLRQVLHNLISNAVRHGGSEITVLGRPDGGGFSVAVGDDGPGVPARTEGRLFTRFVHSADQALITGSVGLGLAITRLLIEGMGGTVVYERRDGHTWFTARFGSAPLEEGALASQPISASTAAGQGSREPMCSS